MVTCVLVVFGQTVGPWLIMAIAFLSGGRCWSVVKQFSEVEVIFFSVVAHRDAIHHFSQGWSIVVDDGDWRWLVVIGGEWRWLMVDSGG